MRTAERKRRNSRTKERNQNTKDICKEKPLARMGMSKRLESCLREKEMRGDGAVEVLELDLMKCEKRNFKRYEAS